jgi:hypothetical protein
VILSPSYRSTVQFKRISARAEGADSVPDAVFRTHVDGDGVLGVHDGLLPMCLL